MWYRKLNEKCIDRLRQIWALKFLFDIQHTTKTYISLQVMKHCEICFWNSLIVLNRNAFLALVFRYTDTKTQEKELLSLASCYLLWWTLMRGGEEIRQRLILPRLSQLYSYAASNQLQVPHSSKWPHLGQSLLPWSKNRLAWVALFTWPVKQSNGNGCPNYFRFHRSLWWL